MNDLPVTTPAGDNPIGDTNPTSSLTNTASAMNLGSAATGKEKETGGFSSQELPIQDLGKEIELSHEVAQSGVSVKPTTIPIPKPVASMGVVQVGGQAIPPTATRTVPLTDDQIAQGLHQNILSSWRWLSEWCVRKLKQIGISRK